MKEFYYTIEVTGYVDAKNKKEALKKVKEYNEDFMFDDPFRNIEVESI